jgi:hypothetical protein
VVIFFLVIREFWCWYFKVDSLGNRMAMTIRTLRAEKGV